MIDTTAANDVLATREAARTHSEDSTKVITSLPAAHDTVLSDPAMAGLLASMLQRG